MKSLSGPKKIKAKLGLLLTNSFLDILDWFEFPFGFVLICKDKFHIMFKFLKVTYNEHRYWINQTLFARSSKFWIQIKVGDCLFDSIAYLLNYSIILELIWKNSMCYL